VRKRWGGVHVCPCAWCSSLQQHIKKCGSLSLTGTYYVGCTSNCDISQWAMGNCVASSWSMLTKTVFCLCCGPPLFCNTVVTAWLSALRPPLSLLVFIHLCISQLFTHCLPTNMFYVNEFCMRVISLHCKFLLFSRDLFTLYEFVLFICLFFQHLLCFV